MMSRISDGDARHSIRIVRELDDSTFSRYQSAVQAVLGVRESTQLALMEKNFLRLEALELFYKNSLSRRHRSEHFDARSALRSLAAEILNWLTSARMFLDHHLTQFADVYGKESSELRQLKDAIKSEYDSSQSYRFTYKLRDYSQHCGFPLSSVNVSTDETSEERGVATLFYAEKGELLADFDWKSIVQADLDGMPDKIDVVQHIREARPCFRRIYAWILRFRCDQLADDIETIREICRSLEGNAGDPYLMTCELDGEGGFSQISHQPVPVSLANAISEGSEIERVIDRLERAVATDEAAQLANPAGYSDDVRESLKVGAGLLDLYFQRGGSDQLYWAAVDEEITRSDGDVGPLISGMTVIAAVALSLAGSALGTSAQDIAGGLLRTNE